MTLTTIGPKPGPETGSEPEPQQKQARNKVNAYIRLVRADKPIGTYLLLWPTLIALFLAADGMPSWKNLVIFVLGTFLMRSAGCVINDYADREVDGSVKRTSQRPLATGELSANDALKLFALLIGLSFLLVLLTNLHTILLSFCAALVAAAYPFMKRYTHFPQVVLGVAFAFGIPMAFTAEYGSVTITAWLLFVAKVLWTTAYDTFYAMVDRDDDIKIGIKSTAVLFGDYDRLITAILQICVLALLFAMGISATLHWPFFLGLAVAAILFIHQQRLIAQRQREDCFRAFLNNHWVGAALLMSVIIDLTLY